MRALYLVSKLEEAAFRGARKRSLDVVFSPPKDWSARNMLALDIMQSSLTTPSAPPTTGTLLLPTSDSFALVLARRRKEFMALGWRVLIGSPSSLSAIGNKVRLQQFARKHGLTEFTPTEYSLHTARFPCIVKKGTGEYGRNVHIASTRRELRRIVQAAPASWVIQELIAGNEEIATTLVVVNGKIKAGMTTFYTYRDREYVWPATVELKKTSSELPCADRAQLEPFVRFFTGVCNVNYKVRPDGRLAIFEINPRVGADFCDAKVSLARLILDTAHAHSKSLNQDKAGKA